MASTKRFLFPIHQLWRRKENQKRALELHCSLLGNYFPWKIPLAIADFKQTLQTYDTVLLEQLLHIIECLQCSVIRGVIRIWIVLSISRIYPSHPISTVTKVMTRAAVETPLLNIVFLHHINVIPEITIHHQTFPCFVNVSLTSLMEARNYALLPPSFTTCKCRIYKRSVGFLHTTQQIIVDVISSQYVRTECS